MKLAYLSAAFLFFFGLGALIIGVTSSEEMTLLGAQFHPRIGKGIGIMAMLTSVIVFLAAFGSNQALPRERRSPTDAQISGHEPIQDENLDVNRQSSPRI